MPESNLIQTFERRLVELGCPPQQTRRAVQEMANHYEDLQHAARNEGLSAAEAEAYAEKRLGEPVVLAEHAASGLRQSSWWGRHRVLGFCILPPLCFGPAWILCVLLCGSLLWLLELAFGPSTGSWVTGVMARIGQAGDFLPILEAVLNASVIGWFAVLFCWLAAKSAAGSKWALFACVTSAVHAVFFHIHLTAHHLAIAYSWKPNWICAISPLLVAGGFFLRQRWRERRPMAAFALPVLFLVLFSGCATQEKKPVSQRGWIGGEYKLARKKSVATEVSASPAMVGCLPQELARKQKAAVLVTSLDTNAPAQAAGLRTDDLVLELNHQPVTRLRDFRRIIDRSAPGSILAVRAYRDRQTLDFEVPVGKEAFRREGSFRIALPSVVQGWDLWPNPGFSLVFVGYEPNPGLRQQPGSSKDHFDEDWKVFAGIFEVSRGKRILAQKD